MQIKKSAVDLTELALGIIVLGIVVSVGASILIIQRNSQVSNLPTYQVANESVTTTQSGANLGNVWVKGIGVVINKTGTVLTSGNYSFTIDQNTGIGTLANRTSINGNVWNVTYEVYNTSDVRYALADDAATGIGEYGNWFKIITIVGVASVVLALIFMAFGRRSGDSTSY